jgi:peroxiredoxin
MRKKIGLCLLLAGLAGLILTAAIGAQEIAPVDSTAEREEIELSRCPDFQLKNLQGERIALADLLGKGPILIDFWATWCKPCIKELPHLQEMYDQYREQGFLVIAISEDKPRSLSKVQSFIAGKKYDFLVLLDDNNAVQRKFNFRAIPYTILLDREGYIHHKRMGYRPGDEVIIEEKLLPLLAGAPEAPPAGEAGGAVVDEPETGADVQRQEDIQEGEPEQEQGERSQKQYIKKVKMDSAKVTSAERHDE